MTGRKLGITGFAVLVYGVGLLAFGQNATSLNAVHSVYVGSFGDQPGAQDLRRALIDALKHSALHVSASAQTDAVLEGIGEIWIRGYHSLSPRARTNDVYAEPIYGGYLSVRARGKNGEILWSYFVNPKRAGFGGDLKHDLAARLVDNLTEAISGSTEASATLASFSGKPVTLRGGGATFPYPIYEQWFSSFQAVNPFVQFAYEPVGSLAGITQLRAGRSDFAGSDIPVSALSDSGTRTSLLEFPSVVGAVVIIYNLAEWGGDLRLTPEVLAGILSGHIRKWNDSAIRALNHGSLPDRPIQVVHRSDGSGTTFALTEYLSKVSESWRAVIGRGATVNWPVGEGANGNEGVSKLVEQTAYSLGYTEFIYAFRHRLTSVSIRNAAGEFIDADLPSIAAAAANDAGSASSDFAVSLSNSPGRQSYPISTYTWLVFSKPFENKPLRQFLQWMLIEGQRQCMALGYAPLPRFMVEREQRALQELK
ncbi:MAG TPA: phosphate ABC transporter substrate-binding protein PstS [Bryobacteraceae bacterium]